MKAVLHAMRFGICLALPASWAVADIVSTSGAVQVIAAPADVSDEAMPSDQTAFVFQESATVLKSSLGVDIVDPGFYQFDSQLQNAAIAAGNSVVSYMITGNDSEGEGAGSQPDLIGSVTFDQDILGVIVSYTTLNGTDGAVANPTTNYLAGTSRDFRRGLEFVHAQTDSVTLSADLRTLSFEIHPTTAVDEIRIIVAPEPTALALLALGGLIGLRRR